jgi:RNA polymerase sigma-70 factor (ECF subfamily)
VPLIPDNLAERLYTEAQADRWAVPPAVFTAALQASADRAAGRSSVLSVKDVERYLTGLHLADLALACACAAGHAAAWDHFVREYRPILYRSADALDPGGGARELADSLYADLYGIDQREGGRASLFRYFHGRSSLATWLRAVLAQRHIDRLRAGRRLEPFTEENEPPAPPAVTDPERTRYLALMQRAMMRAIATLASRDRLRLDCYYAQQLTLAQIGRLVGEHEATVSRQLARTRRAIRQHIELLLATEAGLSGEHLTRCFESVLEDPGSIDLGRMLDRKESAPNRSI